MINKKLKVPTYLMGPDRHDEAVASGEISGKGNGLDAFGNPTKTIYARVRYSRDMLDNELMYHVIVSKDIDSDARKTWEFENSSKKSKKNLSSNK
jgi:hypothetical protein